MSFIRKLKNKSGTYLVEVESYRENGKVKQRYKRYVGKEVDGKTILSSSISNIEIESVKVYGPLMVLNHLAKEINLSKSLGEYGDEILSMVYAHCVEPKSINQMENWFKKTDLNFLLDLSNVTESRLFDALDSINKQDSERLQKNIFEEVKRKYDIDTNGVLYDVTNTYFCGNKSPWGKKGRSKEKQKDRPLVQIGLGVTKKDGIPLFHKTFEGNVHDARTLQGVLPLFKEYDIKRGFFVIDRGISSKENISDLKKINWEVVCGLAINTKLKNIVRETIKQNVITNMKNRIKLSKTALYAFSVPYKLDKIDGNLLVCFNNKMKTTIQESRYDEIHNAQKKLKSNKRIKTGLDKYFDKRGNLRYNKIEKAGEFDGYSCLFSTKDLSNNEIVHIYFEKDLVEKAFQNIKGIIALRPIKHWLYDRVEEHIFICYLSYLLLSLLKYRLKKTGISPIEALSELETLYKVYIKDTEKEFTLSKLVKLTKKQEQILSAVDKKLLKM